MDDTDTLYQFVIKLSGAAAPCHCSAVRDLDAS